MHCRHDNAAYVFGVVVVVQIKRKSSFFSDVEVQIQAEDGSVMTDVLLPHIAMGIKEELLKETVENVLNRYRFQYAIILLLLLA